MNQVSAPATNPQRLRDFAAIALADKRPDMSKQLYEIADEYEEAEDRAERYYALTETLNVDFSDMFPDWPNV